MPPQDDLEHEFGEESEFHDPFPDDGMGGLPSDYFADEVSDDFPDDEFDDPAEAEDGEMPNYGN